MELLKNKRAWKKWATENGLLTQEGPAKEPVEYPCFGYTSCRSFGYEELNEHYLYLNKLKSMVSDLYAAAEAPAHDVMMARLYKGQIAEVDGSNPVWNKEILSLPLVVEAKKHLPAKRVESSLQRLQGTNLFQWHYRSASAFWYACGPVIEIFNA